MRTALFGQTANLERVYGAGRREELAGLTELYPHFVTGENLDEHLPQLAELEVIFSTWGMPALTAEQVARLPKLSAVFYAAGSVKGFAGPLLSRGVRIMSAWGANAVSVAEFAGAQIILAGKGYFQNQRDAKIPGRWRSGQVARGRGNYGARVALLGLGQVARETLKRLRGCRLELVAVDPYLSPAAAQELGVERIELAEAFATSNVVSNHLPLLPATRGMLTGELFASLPYGATFINTGRGGSVKEDEMIAVLERRPDLTALLDVTDPEPPADDSPLYRLPNVFLSSHQAGAAGDETLRLADYCLEAFAAWRAGRPLPYEITASMLDTMA